MIVKSIDHKRGLEVQVQGAPMSATPMLRSACGEGSLAICPLAMSPAPRSAHSDPRAEREYATCLAVH
jgi:hypothetical protein